MTAITEFTGLQVPRGGFKAICADPPWSYKVFSKKGESRSAEKHYRTMTVEEICQMPVPEIAAKNANLFLWTTGPNLPNSLLVMTAWGFTYSSMAFVWVKLNPRAPLLFYDSRSFHFGMGHTTRKNAEFCLLGLRGKPGRNSKSVRELLISHRREHSRKPPEAPERIEKYCDGPYLELFSRESRDGWSTWGDQATKFDPKGDAR